MKFSYARKLRREAKEIVRKGMNVLEMSPTALAGLFKAAKTYKLLKSRMENNGWLMPPDDVDNASDGASWHTPEAGSQCSLPDLSEDEGSAPIVNPFYRASATPALPPDSLGAAERTNALPALSHTFIPRNTYSTAIRNGTADSRQLSSAASPPVSKTRHEPENPQSASVVEPCNSCLERKLTCVPRYSKTDVRMICEACLRRKTKCSHTANPLNRQTRSALGSPSSPAKHRERRKRRFRSSVTPTSDGEDVAATPVRSTKRARTVCNVSPDSSLLPGTGSCVPPPPVIPPPQVPAVTATDSGSPSSSFIAEILFPFPPDESPQSSSASIVDPSPSDGPPSQAVIPDTADPHSPPSTGATAPTHLSSPACKFHFHEMAHSYWNFTRLSGHAGLHISLLEKSIREQQELLSTVQASQAHLANDTHAMFESMRAFVDLANQGAPESSQTEIPMIDVYGQLTTQLFNRFQRAYEDGTLASLKEEDIVADLVLRD